MPHPAHDSFMKLPRAHYQMRGGKVIAAALALLLGLLALLLVEIDTGITALVTPQRAVMAMFLDLALLLILISYAVIHRATMLWRRARDSVIGTRLQSRIILMFSIVAIVPTLVVAGFSILFFNVGLKAWFDTQVATALENSVSIATAYIEEHKDAIRNDALSIGQALHDHLGLIYTNPSAFKALLANKSAEHYVSEAIVLDRAHVIARTDLSFSLVFERLPDQVLERASNGEVAIFGDDREKIQAVVKISRLPDLYLMVVRVVDPKVLDHMQTAVETVDKYHALQSQLEILQNQFFTLFVLVALLVLLAALWAGMLLAVRLIEPLRALMQATERVSAGDYTTRVPEGRKDDEISNLGRTFNRMTGQLETQRRDLMDATRLIDERRRFTEAVLSGVSAGVIALDPAQKVTLHNRTALALLNQSESLIGREIVAFLPDVAPLLMAVSAKPEKLASADVALLHPTGGRATLHVQVTAEHLGGTIEGYIVTFDDITELVAAQRSAAWADVARRIAHEIKNPLTPITLSAERLRKKFGPEITSDREAYDRYLDTIARHVRDIGRMVEEFVTYARLPMSVYAEENLVAIIRKTVFSAQTATPDVLFRQSLPDGKIPFLCDEAQFGQALLNLFKNASEALESAEKKEILVTLAVTETAITLTVEDTGPGFPEDKIASLTEPYVTTRTKGTGLGLAIVKRTVEEHKGTMSLSNREGGGARVKMVFVRG